MKLPPDSILNVPRVGKALAKDFENLGVRTLSDMLSLLPRAYEDRRFERRVKASSEDNPYVYCRIFIERKSYFPTKAGRTLKVSCRDDDMTELNLLCFNRDFLDRQLRIGDCWYISASVQKSYGSYNASAFELKRTKEEAGIGSMLPIYPLSGSLTQKMMRSAARFAIYSLTPIEDCLPQEMHERLGLMHRDAAFRAIHMPKDPKQTSRARTSLAFTELFLLELQLVREKGASGNGKPGKLCRLEQKLLESLPFSLTDDQMKVIGEIDRDLDSHRPMNRLLQGDVGSGKTLVAWLSSLHVIENHGQVAFMAPTELLARQHAEKAAELLAPLGIRICFLTGEVMGKKRKLLTDGLRDGEIDLAIGTHALFSSDVEFRNLSYVIIDEQHRFGVEQMNTLTGKGKRPNVLAMTATPIPRTLALTVFADQDISTIRTMPNGRIPIKTHLVRESRREEMFAAIEVEFKRGHQAYFVYPRITDEGESDLRDVNTMYEELRKRYPNYRSRMIHSKLADEEKMEILTSFRLHELDYLVSTSVVEVGIDIPNATVIVIEHAERFGLAALHQLRGRVGRSDLPSHCFLVFGSSLTEEGKERLKILNETNDGFLIAEKDLEIRGPGDIVGSRQSGFISLKYASLTEDYELINQAKAEAERIVREDRGLIKGENACLRQVVMKEGKL